MPWERVGGAVAAGVDGAYERVRMSGCGREECTERMEGGRVAERRLPARCVGVRGSCGESEDGESSACVVNLLLFPVSTRGRSACECRGTEWSLWGGTGGSGDASPRGVVLGMGSRSAWWVGSSVGGISFGSYSAGVTAPLSLDTHSSSSPPVSTGSTSVRLAGDKLPFT